MQEFEQLWAKTASIRDCAVGQETLKGHTKAVLESAAALTRVLRPCFQELFCLSREELSHLSMAIEIGAWLHDPGKANDHFQRMLRDPSFRQGVRHETISLVIAWRLRDWLNPLFRSLPSWAWQGAVFAACGHHLSFPDPHAGERLGTEVTVYTAHPDFLEVLNLGRNRFGLPALPELTNWKISLLRKGLRSEMRTILREWDVEISEEQKRLLSAIKATVIAADLAGSALPKRNIPAAQWIKERLERTLTRSQMEDVVKRRLKGGQPRPFQRKVQNSQKKTVLVEAGCGSGKTAAAYLWASENAVGKRLFFCYPTTGTASEGFAGYLFDPDFEAMLIHSRSQADYRLLSNMPSPGHEENLLRQMGLEALETWPIPVAVCTAHTVLGLLGNVRRGLFAWPSMANAAFVFDEVHAFSDRLFGYLLRFLETFSGAPVLLMTATLPPARREAIEKLAHLRGGVEVIAGPEARERAPRYVMSCVEGEEAWKQAQECLQAGGKILWIVNTVGRCMKILDRALERGLPAEPYHSRYRYCDRLKRQRRVIDGFAPGKPPMLAITTQVAEMSLDLSADLLVSEYAPVPALIQRMGRLNRSEECPSAPRSALFIQPENRLPYTGGEEEQSIWTSVEGWLGALCDGKAKSQKDLHEFFVEHCAYSTEIPQPERNCEWLDGLWQTVANRKSIEEAGYTLEFIREEDEGEGLPIECAIPMPFPHTGNWQQWRRQGRFPIAPSGSINYDERRGAKWNIG